LQELSYIHYQCGFPQLGDFMILLRNGLCTDGDPDLAKKVCERSEALGMTKRPASKAVATWPRSEKFNQWVSMDIWYVPRKVAYVLHMREHGLKH